MRHLFLAAALLSYCSGQPTPAPVPVPPQPAPVPTIGPPVLTCVDACARLTELGCEEAKPTNAGASCVQVCENAGDLPVACITRAETCELAESCE